MYSINHLLYSLSAAARILGVPPHQVGRLEVWPNVVFCVVSGRARFMSKQAFRTEFAEFRKRSSLEIRVKQWASDQTRFTATNPQNQHQHSLRVYPDHVACNCDDYARQVQLLGSRQVMCKHGYAVLRELGLDSLRSFMQVVNERGLARVI